MRKVIDANDLKEWVENWFVKNNYYHPYSRSHSIPVFELYEILERMPTVDAEPRPTGYWIYKKHRATREAWIGYYQCSECGHANWIKEDNYCSNCGAKMEAQDDN